METTKKIKGGDIRAASRLIRNLEDRIPEAKTTIKHLFPLTGKAHVIGITGSPGAGKSTLTDGLIDCFRRKGKTVGVLAVDPTSPFTGGAILGDRIRMQRHAEDPGVFVRSLATRGALGGLAKAVGDAIHVMDVLGKDIIIVETVGTGQQEVDIINHSHTVLVVLVPGMGDEIQAIKAGILEIADILVVNKADRPGAQNTVRALRAMLELGHRLRNAGHHGVGLLPAPANSAPALDSWSVPVIETIATEHTGIADVLAALDEHRAHLHRTGEIAGRERQRVEAELLARLREALLAHLLTERAPDALEETIQRILRRELDPGAAVRALVEGL